MGAEGISIAHAAAWQTSFTGQLPHSHPQASSPMSLSLRSVSSIVLPRQGAGFTLLSAAAGVGQNHLSYDV